MTRDLRRLLRRTPLRLALVVLAAAGLPAALPAAAQPVPLPHVGQVGRAVEWSVGLEPTTFGQDDAVLFVARGILGAAPGSEIGWLRIEGIGGRLRVRADFPALGGAEVRVLRTGVPPVISTSPAEVEVAGDQFPAGNGLAQSVGVSLVHASATGELVPAPSFVLRFGAEVEVVVAGETFVAHGLTFVARRPFPPPQAPSATLERVDVFTSLPSLSFAHELAHPGVLFAGVPVVVSEGVPGVELDPSRNAISAVELGVATPLAAGLLAPFEAGVAVTWEPEDLAAGGPGARIELSAVEEAILHPALLGTVEVLRGSVGWNLRFYRPGAQETAVLLIDGEPVGEVSLAPTGSAFALSTEAPAGAEVFPLGLGEGAVYGFSWDRPVPILVPALGTFTGRSVRIVLAETLGPFGRAVLVADDLPSLTLTGVATAAVDDGGPCIASSTRLCLAGGRFAVDVAWSDPFGGSGPGVAVPLTADTGSFWFFSEVNLEMMVKVLDACPVNGHFWVFAGGLTNVEVELTVTDTRTGNERVYRNPQGQAFQPIQDTAAFPCTP